MHTSQWVWWVGEKKVNKLLQGIMAGIFHNLIKKTLICIYWATIRCLHYLGLLRDTPPNYCKPAASPCVSNSSLHLSLHSHQARALALCSKPAVASIPYHFEFQVTILFFSSVYVDLTFYEHQFSLYCISLTARINSLPLSGTQSYPESQPQS